MEWSKTVSAVVTAIVVVVVIATSYMSLSTSLIDDTNKARADENNVEQMWRTNTHCSVSFRFRCIRRWCSVLCVEGSVCWKHVNVMLSFLIDIWWFEYYVRSTINQTSQAASHNLHWCIEYHAIQRQHTTIRSFCLGQAFNGIVNLSAAFRLFGLFLRRVLLSAYTVCCCCSVFTHAGNRNRVRSPLMRDWQRVRRKRIISMKLESSSLAVSIHISILFCLFAFAVKQTIMDTFAAQHCS